MTQSQVFSGVYSGVYLRTLMTSIRLYCNKLIDIGHCYFRTDQNVQLQTVNLLAYAFTGSSPAPRTTTKNGPSPQKRPFAFIFRLSTRCLGEAPVRQPFGW